MTNLIYRDGFYVNTSRPQHLTMDEVVNEIVIVSGYSANLLNSKTRKAEICVWRQIAMYVMARSGNFSLKTIGRYWGNRDHSTIIAARDRVQDLIDSNDPFVVLKLREIGYLVSHSNSGAKVNYSTKRYNKIYGKA